MENETFEQSVQDNAAPVQSEFVVPALLELAAAAKPEAKAEEAKPEAKADEAAEHTPEQKAAAREAFYARRAKKAADDAIAEVAELKREVETLRTQPRQNDAFDAPKAPARPNPANYDLGRWDPKYEEAVADYQDKFEEYVAEKAIHAARTATESNLQRAQETTENASLAATADAVGKRGVDKYSDFEEVVQDALMAMPPSPQALQRLVKLENAEDVFYHLGQHPDLLEKITAMEPMDQTLEFGKISARLAGSAKVAAKTTTAKPMPTTPRGTNGQFAKDSDASYERMLKASRNTWQKRENKCLTVNRSLLLSRTPFAPRWRTTSSHPKCFAGWTSPQRKSARPTASRLSSVSRPASTCGRGPARFPTFRRLSRIRHSAQKSTR